VWRSLAILVDNGPVKMGISTAVGIFAGTHIHNNIADFNPIEQEVPGANL
jgi:hypothetical protein